MSQLDTVPTDFAPAIGIAPAEGLESEEGGRIVLEGCLLYTSPGPKEALEAALEMASDMGFKTHDAEGYIGFADFPGKSDTQLGIIGHMDVVPAGPGWTFEPYEVCLLYTSRCV